jgi:hypothetical protein
MCLKTIIKYFLVICMLFISMTVYAEGISLVMDFDKDIYKTGDIVSADLRFNGVSDETTNSLMIKLRYDISAIELATDNIEQDITDGYIPFNLKVNSTLNDEINELNLSYVSISEDIHLKDDDIVASIAFKIKDDFSADISVITITEVSIISSEFDSYTVNAGDEVDFTIKIENEDINEEQEDNQRKTITQRYSGNPNRKVETENEQKADAEEKENQEIINEQIGSIDSNANNHIFEDIENHWAKEDVMHLFSEGIIKGFNENNFAPDLHIKRAEFIALVLRALEINSVTYKDAFIDIGTELWYADIVQAAVDANIVTGYDGEFRPEEYITREEIVKIIIEGWEIDRKNINYKGLEKYSDKNDISQWAVEYMAMAIELDLIKGINEIKLAPKEYATRAEAAVMIYRLLDR